ncbi:kelch repeat-containing protein [Kitasatospora sp. NPDC005856]|uniref:Kelch repeat-containing protein n=1 Tax=Kitasatospora sp. NPDC005856 TaxID=3154566 RepID=UPI0033CF7F8D
MTDAMTDTATGAMTTAATIAAAASGGAWTKSGDLPSPASWYGQYDGAVLLKSGKVLLVGGSDAAAAVLTRTAVYDPAAGTWTAGVPLRFPRRLHTVTRLDDGRVLIAGGTSGASPLSPGLAGAELYDPADGSWKTAADMREARWGHSAVLLADKRVLVAGGVAVRSGDSVKALRSAEIYDPATDTWTDAGPMTDARTGHSAVLFKGGQVLVCGGTAPISGHDDASLAFCELYNPVTKAWTPTGSLLRPRSRHQAVAASDTVALVFGGATPGAPGDGTYDPFAELTAERYDLATGTWAAMPASPGGRGLHRVVPLGGGKFLLVGGTAEVRDGVGYSSALVFDDTTRAWTAAPGTTVGRWAFAATALSDGRVLIAGGTVRAGLAAADPAVHELTATTEVLGAAS